MAEIVAVVFDVTDVVVIVKVAVVDPAATVTLAGTFAEPLLLESVTKAPFVGAGPLKVTVPVDDDPPVTLAGFTESELKAGAFTVSVVVLETPL